MSKQPAPENPVVAPEIDAGSGLKRRTGTAPPFVSSVNEDEPVVTRKELWSYYRAFYFFVPDGHIAYAIYIAVYYNGDNVRPIWLISTCNR